MSTTVRNVVALNGVEWAIYGLGIAMALVLVVANLYLPIQLILLMIGLIVAFIINRRVGVVVLAVLLIPQ